MEEKADKMHSTEGQKIWAPPEYNIRGIALPLMISSVRYDQQSWVGTGWGEQSVETQ